MRIFYFLHIATGVVLIGLLVGFFNLRSEKSGRSGVIESTPASASVLRSGAVQRSQTAPLTFINHRGEKTSDRDFRGSHTLVFFGYSHCPDVCPGNLATMKQALDQLGPDAARIQPLFVSFDAARDTPERLAEYVSHFHPDLIGLTGTNEEIEAATRAYGVFHDLSGGEGAGGLETQHSSNTYLIGPDGEARAIFGHATPPEEMVARLRAILASDGNPVASALR